MSDHFSEMMEDSRVWVFPSAQMLSTEAKAQVGKQLDEFLATWDAHGASVRGAYTIDRERFLLVAADSASAHVSGCSIDGLSRAARNALESAGTQLADYSQIFYWNGEEVEVVDRPKFAELVNQGKIGEQTLMFDPSVTTLKEYQERWCRPFSESWHASVFRKSA